MPSFPSEMPAGPMNTIRRFDVEMCLLLFLHSWSWTCKDWLLPVFLIRYSSSILITLPEREGESRRVGWIEYWNSTSQITLEGEGQLLLLLRNAISREQSRTLLLALGTIATSSGKRETTYWYRGTLLSGKAWSFLCPQLHFVGNPEAGDPPMTSLKKGRRILQLILFLLKKLALPGSGEAVDLVSKVDLGESVYRVYFEAVDSVFLSSSLTSLFTTKPTPP